MEPFRVWIMLLRLLGGVLMAWPGYQLVRQVLALNSGVAIIGGADAPTMTFLLTRNKPWLILMAVGIVCEIIASILKKKFVK